MPSRPPRQVSSRSANLQAQIDGQAREVLAGRLDTRGQAELVELLLLRGHVLGCIADYETAEARAEQLTQDSPTDGVAFLARARARATFHCFADALGDLDQALRLGADPADVDAERRRDLSGGRTLRRGLRNPPQRCGTARRFRLSGGAGFAVRRSRGRDHGRTAYSRKVVTTTTGYRRFLWRSWTSGAP